MLICVFERQRVGIGEVVGDEEVDFWGQGAEAWGLGSCACRERAGDFGGGHGVVYLRCIGEAVGS